MRIILGFLMMVLILIGATLSALLLGGVSTLVLSIVLGGLGLIIGIAIGVITFIVSLIYFIYWTRTKTPHQKD